MYRIYYVDISGLSSAKGLQSGENGDFQPLYAKISSKRQVIRPQLL